jgi:hypothetical protein
MPGLREQSGGDPREIGGVTTQKSGLSGPLRVAVLSALSAVAAPLVLVGIVVGRKAERRLTVLGRQWTKRLRHEIARWS